MSKKDKMYEYQKHVKSDLNIKLNNIRNMVKNKNFKNAYNELKKLEDEYMYNPYYIEELGIYYYELAQMNNNNKEYFSKALDYFNSITSENNKCYTYYYIGKIYLIQHDYEEAEYYFNVIINSNYKNKNYAYLELSKIYKYKKNYSEAIDCLNSIDLNNYNMGQTFIISSELEKVSNYYALAKIEEGNKIIKNLLNDKKNRTYFDKIYYVKADFEFSNRNYELAQKYASKIKQLNSRDILLKASIEYKLDNLEDAFNLCCKISDNSTLSEEKNILIAKIKFKNDELDEAYNMFDLLIKNNPENINLYYYLGLINFRNKKLVEARDNFNICINKNLSNVNVCKLQILYINIKENNIKDAYLIYKELNSENFFIEDKSYLGLAMSAYFNKYYKAVNFNEHNLTYSLNQVINYSEFKAKKHITEHKQEFGENHSVFDDSVDIDEIIKFAKESIKENEYYRNNFFDEYIIEYKNSGIFNGVLQNYIKVVTLPNTKDIITIYPFSKMKQKKLNYTEENYVSKKYVKRLSQIEKFYKRYGNKK